MPITVMPMFVCLCRGGGGRSLNGNPWQEVAPLLFKRRVKKRTHFHARCSSPKHLVIKKTYCSAIWTHSLRSWKEWGRAAQYRTLAYVLPLPGTNGAGTGLPWCCGIIQPALTIWRQRCILKSCPSWGLVCREQCGASAGSAGSRCLSPRGALPLWCCTDRDAARAALRCCST